MKYYGKNYEINDGNDHRYRNMDLIIELLSEYGNGLDNNEISAEWTSAEVTDLVSDLKAQKDN